MYTFLKKLKQNINDMSFRATPRSRRNPADQPALLKGTQHYGYSLLEMVIKLAGLPRGFQPLAMTCYWEMHFPKIGKGAVRPRNDMECRHADPERSEGEASPALFHVMLNLFGYFSRNLLISWKMSGFPQHLNQHGLKGNEILKQVQDDILGKGTVCRKAVVLC